MRITVSRRVAVLAAVAAIGLAGCTSEDTGSDPTAGPTAPSVDTARPTGAASTDAPSTDDAASPADDPAGGSESADGADSEDSGGAGAALPSPTSVAPSSRSPKPTPSTPKPSGSGVVDEFGQTDVAWFGAMCAALVDKPASKLPDLESQELPARREAAVALFTDQADRLDAAVGALEKAGTPNITHGDKLSESVLEAFPKISAAARQGATDIGASGDEQGYQQAVAEARDAMNVASEDLVAFNEMLAAPAMITQLQQVPECAELVGGV